MIFFFTIIQELEELQERFQKLNAMKLYLKDQSSKVRKVLLYLAVTTIFPTTQERKKQII
jgi:hypothetical protein